MSSQYIANRAEILCTECGDEADIAKPKDGSLATLESIRFLHLSCLRCSAVSRSFRICELLIVRLAKLTDRRVTSTEQSDNQLTVKIDELKDLISSLRPMVASTSFALGILYRELADIYESLGQMNKCVEAYKLLIPIVE